MNNFSSQRLLYEAIYIPEGVEPPSREIMGQERGKQMILYHTGYQEIRYPDIRFGRKNADFGQGFYLTRDGEFAKRWARHRAGSDTYVNRYELKTEGLQIRHFDRDESWHDYIFSNRTGSDDEYPDTDVVIGPIANDTLYDTLGVLTSGLLEKDRVLQLLIAGPLYEQVVIKTERALEQLRWIAAEKLTADMVSEFRRIVKQEEAAYQEAIAKILDTE